MFEILVIATLLAGLAALGLNLWSPRAPRRRVRRSPRAPFGLLRALLAGEPDTPTTAEPVRAKQTATRPDDEWRHLLSDEQYDVVRRGRTERPFTGRFWDHREDGAYHCVACGQGLFDSADKYDSGHGWPAFTAPLAPDAVTELKAISYGTVRTEVRCRRCEGHLGHVFGDGPGPRGLRYCINSAALAFSARIGADPVHRKAT